MRLTLIYIFMITLCHVAWSQQKETVKHCISDEMNSHRSQEEKHFFEGWLSRKQSQQNFPQLRDGELKTIPVIFHVLHYGEAIGTGSNLSSTQIQAQLEQVNNDLGKKEGTSGFNHYEFSHDMNIQLAPALLDEQDNNLLEPGINRINVLDEGFGVVGMNGYSQAFITNTILPRTQWNPNKYLNVWIIDISSNVLGFAQFPESDFIKGGSSQGNIHNKDGIIINYRTVGSVDVPNPNATSGIFVEYCMGRTLTHELGHWLGLHHTWGEGGCQSDDYCSDTPSSSQANYGCPTVAYSCNSDDLVENYMDYTNDICKNTFTIEQYERVITVLQHSPRRASLLHSNKATPPASVGLGDFNATSNQFEIEVEWITTFEQDNSYFILFKRDDKSVYRRIAVINGKDNTIGTSFYSFIDKEPYLGTNYYKLIQVDGNGFETEIGVRQANYFQGFQLEAFPNPTQGKLDITISSDEETNGNLRVFDMNGKQVHSCNIPLNIGDNNIYIDTEKLSKGIYILQVISNYWERHIKIQKS